MAAVDQRVTYLRKLHAGAVVSVDTVVHEVHAKRIVLTHEMRNDETGEIAARTTLTAVHLDTSARKSGPFPARVVASARAPAASATGLVC